MFKKLQAKLRNKKGFTLVELLIVIAVLGIIAAIAVPRFTGVLSGVKDKADVRAAELWAKEIEAEFMVEAWTIADKAVLTIAKGTTERDGYDGAFPKDSTGNAMIATITRSDKTFKLNITNNAKASLVKDKDITPPIDFKY